MKTTEPNLATRINADQVDQQKIYLSKGHSDVGTTASEPFRSTLQSS